MRFSSSSQFTLGAFCLPRLAGGCAPSTPLPYDSTSKRTRRSTSRAPRMASYSTTPNWCSRMAGTLIMLSLLRGSRGAQHKLRLHRLHLGLLVVRAADAAELALEAHHAPVGGLIRLGGVGEVLA